MKQFGKEFFLRGSNKKYKDLDDLDWLFEQLQIMSIGQFCKKFNYPYNSVRYRVRRYFTEDQLALIKKDRAFHQKNKTKLK